MDNNLVLLALIVVGIYVLSRSKFQDIEQTYKQNYDNQSNPPACDYTLENRPYPSGKVPASYLGLSAQERQQLLVKFMEYNGTLPDFQTT